MEDDKQIGTLKKNRIKAVIDMNLAEQFGDMDIYLFDQLLKGRVTEEMQILDAGCGSGGIWSTFAKWLFGVRG
ncbi:hypothetical protein [Brevibacillus brevis]|uniref:hypothetical protein n=1 Tax=Brevibacillus brevis TaxID=1393 RepID=UPI003D221AF2